MMDPHLLPPNVLEKIADPEERKRLGYIPPSERKARDDRKAEGILHEQVANLLRLRGVKYIGHSRMDRKTTRRVGEPDYVFVLRKLRLGRTADFIPCAIELKRPGERPRPKQCECLADMNADGWRTLVADDLESIKDWLDNL